MITTENSQNFTKEYPINFKRRSSASIINATLSGSFLEQEPLDSNAGVTEKASLKTVCMAVSFFVLGIVFLIIGFIASSPDSPFPESDRNSTRLAGFILAGLLLIPGCYGLFTIVQIYRKVPGYSWAMLPDPE